MLYLEPLFPSKKLSRIETLEPGKHYSLLRELHYTGFHCKAKDYENFDTEQLIIQIDTLEAEQIIQENSPELFGLEVEIKS